MNPFRSRIVIPLLYALTLGPCTLTHALAAVEASWLAKTARAGVPFVPNRGQWDLPAAFAAHTFAGTMFVTTEGKLVYSLPGKPIARTGDTSPTARPGRFRNLPGGTERTPGW